MKKTILSTFALIAAFSLNAQISYNFETWSSGEPNGWTTFNNVPSASQSTFQQTVNPGQGNSSVKLSTVSCPLCSSFTLSDPLGGAILLGANGEGIPFTQRLISVDFKYKSNPLSNDMGGILVQLTRWDPVQQESEIIGEGWFTSQTQVTNWTNINLPISYISSAIPDTLNIGVFSSIGHSSFPLPGIPSPINGSEFYIDAISLNLPSCVGLQLSTSGTNETSPLAGNGSANAIASGGTAPYTYIWSNGASTANISNLNPGLYSVTVIDANGCTKLASYNVLAGGCNGLSLSITGTNASTLSSNNGSASATVTGGTPPYTYVWSNGDTTANISGLDVGAYSLIVTDNTGTCVQFGFFNVLTGTTTNINTLNSNQQSSISVFPNPSKDRFKINSDQNISKIYISNYLGEIISEQIVNAQNTEIDLSEMADGIYYLNIFKEGKTIEIKKIIVTH